VGFCRIIADRLERESERGEEPTISTAMHTFMTRWQVDLLSFPFTSVRGYIKSVFYAMEQGRLSWRDTDKVKDICTEAIEGSPRLQTDEAPSQPTSTQSKATTKSRTQYCNDFNKGECSVNAKTHTSSRGQVSHVCKFCFTKQGKEFHHPDIKCNNKVKSSKN
jgi:hypothetical protein